MKYAPKKNTAAEEAYIRDIERHGPLEKVERGQARVISREQYPEPLRRYLDRERRTVRVTLSPALRKRLERLSRATGIATDELARQWIEQGIARAAE